MRGQDKASSCREGRRKSNNLDDYAAWPPDLKGRIQGARARAALAVNEEFVRLYHDIGSEILARLGREAWGTRVIDRLSQVLKAAFPDMRGFSGTNRKYMKVFDELYPDRRNGQQAADPMPWFHIVILLTKLPDPGEREWYAAQAIANGWSRFILE